MEVAPALREILHDMGPLVAEHLCDPRPQERRECGARPRGRRGDHQGAPPHDGRQGECAPVGVVGRVDPHTAPLCPIEDGLVDLAHAGRGDDEAHTVEIAIAESPPHPHHVQCLELRPDLGGDHRDLGARGENLFGLAERDAPATDDEHGASLKIQIDGKLVSHLELLLAVGSPHKPDIVYQELLEFRYGVAMNLAVGAKTTQITGVFGAEIDGVDLRRDFAEGEVLTLLEKHLVLVFRDQFLSPADQVTLARSLGEPTPAHPVVPGHPDHPEILVLDAQKGGKNARWHTDVTFVATPPAASVLVAEHVPDWGGDTMWVDTRSAYERLHPALRDAIRDLRAVHRISPLAYWGEPFDTALSREDAQKLHEDSLRVPPVVHPVVRVHPSTGRPSLFVNPGFTSHIVGMSRTESDGLLALLYAHMTQPELALRHRWRPGDVLMWDNRATMHYAIDDYGATERIVRRVTLRGTTPTGPDGFVSHVPSDPTVTVR